MFNGLTDYGLTDCGLELTDSPGAWQPPEPHPGPGLPPSGPLRPRGPCPRPPFKRLPGGGATATPEPLLKGLRPETHTGV